MRLKNIGFTGVILGYAREVVLTDKQAEEAELAAGQETQNVIDNEIVPWTEGTLETVRLAQPGDFVALKYVCSLISIFYHIVGEYSLTSFPGSPVLEVWPCMS